MPEARNATIDIADIVDRSAWRGLPVLVLVLSILVLIADGLDANMLGLAIPALVNAWQVARAEFAPVAAIGAFGMAAGAIFGGLAGDRFGRRRMAIASILLFATTTLAVVFIDNVRTLFVLRALSGLGLGALFPIATAMVAEFTPARHRAKAVSLLNISPPGGGMLAGILGATVLAHLGWQIFFYVGGLSPLLLLIVVVFLLPESPRFLVRHTGDWERIAKIVRRFGHTVPNNTQFVETREEVKSRRYSALIGRHFRRNTIAFCIGFFFLNVVNVTYINWIPTLLNSTGLGLTMGGWTITSSASGAILAGLVSGFVVERIGSRTALLYAAVTACVTILAMSRIILTGEGIYALFLLSGIQGLCVGMMQISLYTAAVNAYPTSIKVSGLGLASGVGRLGGIVSGYAIIAMDVGGDWTFFGIIAVASAAIFLAALSLARPTGAGATRQ